MGVAKFNKDMVQLVADTLDASKQASMDDEDSRVTMMYTAEIVSIDGDIACVRTYADSYQPPYRSERVTRSAYYNLKTGEQVSLEDSLVRHGLSFDTLKSETKQAIKTAKPNIDSVSEGNIDDDDNYTGDHFYYDGKGYIVVLDTGEFDCMAWDTHDLVAHAFDSSYSCGQDVAPERLGPRTCPTSRVKSQEVNYKVPGGARRSDAGDFMMQIGSETSRLGQPRHEKRPSTTFVQVVPAMGRFLTMRQDVYLRFC